MIGKIKKGKSFGGCVRYVMGKDDAKILESDGVLLGTNKETQAQRQTTGQHSETPYKVGNG